MSFNAPNIITEPALPYEVIPAPPAGSPKWLELRRTLGIGGSEAAKVCGVSKWGDPLQVYQDKLGLLPPQEANFAMRAGTFMEPFIAEEYQRMTGFVGVRPQAILRSLEAPWMFASPDWLQSDMRRGADFKRSEARGSWGEQDTEDIPEDYWIQAQVYMFVTKIPIWDVAPLLGNELRRYPIGPDRDSQGDVVNMCGKFWREHVQPRIPPPFIADNYDDPVAAVKSIFRKVEERSIELSPHAALIVEREQAKRDEAKAATEEADRLKAQLLSMMGEANRALIPGEWELTRKASTRKAYTVPESKSVRFTIKRAEQ